MWKQYERFDVINPDNTVYQRIRDKNQAIYDSEVTVDDIWQDRNKVLSLSVTQRLSPSIANAVQPFALYNMNITAASGHENFPKPHMIVYNNTMNSVLPKFMNLSFKVSRVFLI